MYCQWQRAYNRKKICIKIKINIIIITAPRGQKPEEAILPAPACIHIYIWKLRENKDKNRYVGTVGEIIPI